PRKGVHQQYSPTKGMHHYAPTNHAPSSCRLLARRRKGVGRSPSPARGHNTPLPLERSAPASFKRLLGGAAPALRRTSHPPSSAAPPRRRGQSGTSEARVPCSRWRRHPQAPRPRQDTRESKRVSEACPVQVAP